MIVGIAGKTRVLGYEVRDENGNVVSRWYSPPSRKVVDNGTGGKRWSKAAIEVQEWPQDEMWEPDPTAG